jgi:hypothetical protein
MAGDSPSFKWDEYGISAYDAYWYDSSEVSTISGINKHKFVRFDKYGIYGINDPSTNGETWHPTGELIEEEDEEGNKITKWVSPNQKIDKKATFALTWEGLKVTGNDGVVAKIGKDGNHIIKVTKQNGDHETNILSVSNSGELNLSMQSSAIEGQDNLLIRTATFEDSSWRGFDYWSTVYDSNGYIATDSLKNYIKKIEAFYPNGNEIKLPNVNSRNVRTLYQFIKGKKGQTYTFSFNHKMKQKTGVTMYYNSDDEKDYTLMSEPKESYTTPI